MDYLKGKGAKLNIPNKFNTNYLETSDLDGIDEEHFIRPVKTEVYTETPSKIISYNKSPDLSFDASINPYQGCEHGCTYCYARNSHEYWGFSSGLDFESKIIIKPNAALLLEKEFLKPAWRPRLILLSGNTDCYQPLEKKYGLTRKLLQVFLKYRNPVGIITKNDLIKRDVDLLEQLAAHSLVQVIFSINTLDESIRRKMEPRTATVSKKFEAMKILSEAGVKVGAMVAPVVPGLNHHEIPEILRLSRQSGASFAAYATVRLNGQIGMIFKDWLEKVFPYRAVKVWNQIKEIHHGKVNESQFHARQKGDGKMAEIIQQLFAVHHKKYFSDAEPLQLDATKFRRGGNYQLF